MLNEQSEGQRQTGWQRLVNETKRQLHESRSRENGESPADRAAHKTANATIWLAILSCLTLLILYLQLKEMHEGGIDTHNLAIAAGHQATWTGALATSAGSQAINTHELAAQAKIQSDRTKDLADRMKDQADRTEDLVKQATIQANEATVAAVAARQAAATSERALELSERPWLVVNTNIASPLSYDGDGAHITLHYSLTNVGHTPATGVFFDAEFYLPTARQPNFVLERDNMCNSMTSWVARGGQAVIFPEAAPYEGFTSFSISRSKIDESIKWVGFFLPRIVDCVVYSADFSKHLYFVGASYGLNIPRPQGGLLVPKPYQDIPLGQLQMLPEGLSGTATK